jgi:hypothetical protein
VSVLRSNAVGTVTEDESAFQCVALAKWGVGTLGLGSKAMKADIKMKTEGGTYDPLDTIKTVGYKYMNAFKMLDTNRVLIVYSAE